jgi:excisionase family DNA binding protein
MFLVQQYDPPLRGCYRLIGMSFDDVQWMSTADAAKRLGITPRTLYRFIDEGQLPAYRFGRVIRLKASEVDLFIDSCRIEPGTLEHLYPEPVPHGGRGDE